MRGEFGYIRLWMGELGGWEAVQGVPDRGETLRVWLEVCHPARLVGRKEVQGRKQSWLKLTKIILRRLKIIFGN